jgi:hypothetical protein
MLPKRYTRLGAFGVIATITIWIIVSLTSRETIRVVSVPIFVQDEHQNAQPRWLEYASRMRLSGFTLVHIDAHSDMAIPEHYSRNASNRHHGPFTRENISTSNDDFIEDAVHSHLVDAVTWVVPDWGQANEFSMCEYEWNNG